jgi:hypothetical protein
MVVAIVEDSVFLVIDSDLGVNIDLLFTFIALKACTLGASPAIISWDSVEEQAIS